MSIYNTTYKNKINIRCNDTTFETIKVWDPALEQYVPVTGGGGGEPTTLPYYAKTNRVEFEQDTTKATLDEHGLVFNYGDQQESVNFESIRNQQFVIDAHGASLEELDGRLHTVENTILPAHEASLEELDTRLTTVENEHLPSIRNELLLLDRRTIINGSNITDLDTRITAVEGVNTAQDVDINALKTKTENLIRSGIISLGLGFTSASSPRMMLNSTGTIIYAGLPSLNPTGNVERIVLKPASIDFHTASGGSVFLNVERVDNLGKLASVCTLDFNDKINFTKGVTFPGAVETLNTSNKKMVVMDATTKALSYANVPAYVNPFSTVYYKHENNTEGATGYAEVKYTGSTWSILPPSINMSNSMLQYPLAKRFIFDFHDRPMSFNDGTNNGSNHVFLIQGVTKNTICTADYFPGMDDAVVEKISADVVEVPFFNTLAPKLMLRVLIKHNQLSGTNLRYMRGKILLNIYHESDNTSTTTDVVVATG